MTTFYKKNKIKIFLKDINFLPLQKKIKKVNVKLKKFLKK